METENAKDIKFTHADYYYDFHNTVGVDNIEFGAGKSYFGKVEFSKCFLTDKIDFGAVHFLNNNIIVDDTNIHYLDGIADFYNYDFEDKKFENLIFCNPYYYGCNSLSATERFLNRCYDLLQTEGKIHIFGGYHNSYVNKIQKWFDKLDAEMKSKWQIEELDDKVLSKFNSKYDFRTYESNYKVELRFGFILTKS